jgi:hypothetical protein
MLDYGDCNSRYKQKDQGEKAKPGLPLERKPKNTSHFIKSKCLQVSWDF